MFTTLCSAHPGLRYPIIVSVLPFLGRRLWQFRRWLQRRSAGQEEGREGRWSDRAGWCLGKPVSSCQQDGKVRPRATLDQICRQEQWVQYLSKSWIRLQIFFTKPPSQILYFHEFLQNFSIKFWSKRLSVVYIYRPNYNQKENFEKVDIFYG